MDRSFFPLVVTYYCISSFFLFWRIDSFIKDLIVAPLYFVLPTGIGLLIFSLSGTHRKLADRVGAGPLVLMGTFVGMVAVTLLYQDVERLWLLKIMFPYLYTALLVLSLMGYFRSRTLLTASDATLKSTAVTLAWLVPVALLSYYLQYLKFSSFPLRDIFQETHFMKGAHELSRFQVLNPFITASYLSIIQVHQGLLNHFYNYNLLNSQWILPGYTYVFHLGCYAAFFSVLIREISGVRLALALATVISPMFLVVNMAMLESMLLVFFAILIRLDGEKPAPRRALFTAFWLLLLFAIYYVYFNYPFVASPTSSSILSPYSGMWAVGLILFIMSYRLQQASIADSILLAFLAISMFAIHRGILLFLPMLLLIYLVYAAVFHSHLLNKPHHRWLLVFSIFTVFTIFATSLLLFDYYLTVSSAGNGYWTSSIAQQLGTSLLRGTLLVGGGTGFTHSLVEYLRLSPPMVLLSVFTLMLVYIVSCRGSCFNSGSRITSSGSPVESGYSDNLNRVLFLVMAITPLVLLVHSTVPYVYRGAFFPSLLTIVLLAILYGFYRSITADMLLRWLPAWVFLVVAGTLFSHFFLYGYRIDSANNDSSYLQALYPLPQIMALFLILLLFVLILYRRRATVVMAIATVTAITVIALDTMSFRTWFYDKAYGAELPNNGTITHYSLNELQLAEMLRAQPAYTLLVSDPYTLSILRAMSGLNSAYSFANIDLVTDPDIYKNAFRILARIGTLSQDLARNKLFTCADRIRGTVGGEAAYLWRRLQPGETLGTEKIYDHFLWVVSARTLRWADEDGLYYPDNSRLDSQLIEMWRSYFDIHVNLDDKLLVLKLKRSVASSAKKLTARETTCECQPAPSRSC